MKRFGVVDCRIDAVQVVGEPLFVVAEIRVVGPDETLFEDQRRIRLCAVVVRRRKELHKVLFYLLGHLPVLHLCAGIIHAGALHFFQTAPLLRA